MDAQSVEVTPEEVKATLSSWHSYPKIYNLGHAALAELLLDKVLVQEKVDGSQFSFGKFLDEKGNEYLRARSRGAELNVIAPEKMFSLGIAHLQTVFDKMKLGWTYRCEYLQKPKHNSLTYDRIPRGHLALFDVNTGEEKYLTHVALPGVADSLGIDVVPVLDYGIIDNLEVFRRLLDTVSMLGGQKVEGVVVKNYGRFGPDKKVLMGKFVSEAFKEIHAGEWKAANPTQTDIVDRLAMKYRTPARWGKAVQHLKEAGKLDHSPRDIGLLIREVPEDLMAECGAEIAADVMGWLEPKLGRAVIRGLAEWYKEELLKTQAVHAPQVVAPIDVEDVAAYQESVAKAAAGFVEEKPEVKF